MNRRMVAAVMGVAVMLCVGLVRAAEKPPADYVAAMKAINSANGQLRGMINAETKDFAAIAKAAAELKPSAEVTAKFWADRKAEVGTKLSADVLKAVTDLEAAAKANNADGVMAAGRVISGSCRTCHTAHRSERMPDGTYEIK